MYSYDMMLKDIESINYAEITNIGISYGGKIIPCLHIGSKYGKQLIICSGIHAREHITSLLAIKLLDYYAKREEDLCGCGIYFIPMANPDGVDLCIDGLDSIKSLWDKNNLLKINHGCCDFTLWKANLCGVDLNVNFDAKFGTGIANINFPNSENYIGEYPLSEPETQALAEFTLKINPAAVICYHCKGEVIYWKFYQTNNLLRDTILADILSESTGYALLDETGSAGGYKDWCIQKLNIPAFTIEVGNDTFPHPFPYSEIDNIFNRNKDVPALLLKNLL